MQMMDSAGLVNGTTTTGMAGNATDVFDEMAYVYDILGPQRLELDVVIPITCFYPLVFLLGVCGNLLTCVVIYKNTYMHTTTNFYLFTLAVSDVLMLVLGLPLELYAFWHHYPYLFPEFICSGRALISEMTTNASILTITAFTIERYIAICYPFFAQTVSTLARTKCVISLIWVMALAGAAPYAYFLRVNYLYHPETGQALPQSANCNIPPEKNEEMFWLLVISSSVFFLLPLTVLSVLYVLIAIALQRSIRRFDMEQLRCGVVFNDAPRAQTQSRKSIVRMLFFVCLAFFVCWAPFHSQRLLWAFFVYFKDTFAFKDTFTDINGYLYVIAGCCYYSNSVINVIIYNAMSHRFRDAFRWTIQQSTCLHRRRELDYAFTLHHSNGPRSGRRQSAPPSLPHLPSMPPSRRASHMPLTGSDLVRPLELSELRLRLLDPHRRIVDDGGRIRQDSNDSGVSVEYAMVPTRNEAGRRLVRLRQISENSVFMSSADPLPPPEAAKYRGVVAASQSVEMAEHAL